MTGLDLDLRKCDHQVPILTAPAFLLSKCESVKVPKRTRDAFDIYYVLSGKNGEYHAAELRSLAGRFSQVNEQVETLRSFLRDSSDLFNHNVAKHAGIYIRSAASDCLSAISNQ